MIKYNEVLETTPKRFLNIKRLGAFQLKQSSLHLYSCEFITRFVCLITSKIILFEFRQNFNGSLRFISCAIYF